jgi:hypothetical protein
LLPLALVLLASGIPAPLQGAEHYAAPPYTAPSGPELDPETLDGILEELGSLDSEALTVLDRLILWLEELFRANPDQQLPDWFDDFRVPDEVARGIFYAACALIVLLAVGILVNELRFVKRGSRRSRSGSKPATPMLRPEDLPDVTDLPLAQRPGRLLEMIVDRLIGSGKRTSALTHREIRAAAAALDAPPTGLVELAGVAERLRYAAVPPEDAEITRAISGAEALLAGGPAA